MLSKNHRLPRDIFETTFKNGRRLVSPLFSFQYVTQNAGNSRFSAVISKKVAKTAVARNRIRRRIYSALRQLTLYIDKPVHGIFQAKAPIMASSAAETEREIRNLLQKAGIVR